LRLYGYTTSKMTLHDFPRDRFHTLKGTLVMEDSSLRGLCHGSKKVRKCTWVILLNISFGNQLLIPPPIMM
jgi:hypothetical protein